MSYRDDSVVFEDFVIHHKIQDQSGSLNRSGYKNLLSLSSDLWFFFWMNEGVKILKSYLLSVF